MAYSNLLFDTDGRVGIIKINRPELRNVLNWETWMELEEVLHRLHDDPHLRVGIITGVGDEAFIAGADLHMLKERTPRMPLMPRTRPMKFFSLWSRWTNL